MEFFRSLVENQIPQQAALQNLLIKFILDNREYTMFHTLLQYHVLNENLELARILITLGSIDSKPQTKTAPVAPDSSSDPEAPAIAEEPHVPVYYEPAYQAGLDMLKKLKSYDEIVVALINDGLVLRALNFAQAYNVHSMKLSSFLDCVEHYKSEGRTREADVLLKRITEIRKVSQILIMCSTTR